MSFRRKLALICIVILAMSGWGFAASAQTGAKPHRLLIVYETDSTQAAAMEIARGLRYGLAKQEPTALDVYSEYLDSVRFPGAANLDRMASQMSEKYGSVELDMVVALGPTALEFLLANRHRIAPGVPLIFGAVSGATAAAKPLPPDVKGLVSTYDVKQTIVLARRLQPDAREVVVVYGSAPFDKSWGATAKADLGERYLDFNVRHLTDLTLAGFADALGQLPRDTAVLMLTVYQDAEGRKYVPREAAAKIAAASNAPVYSVYDTYLNGGVLGGYMGTFQDVGEQLAVLISRQMAGDGGVPQTTPLTARPVVDWREVERLGIDPGLLPAEAEIRFRDPSLWESYRTEILLIIGILILQSGTIIALFVQGRLRRKAEAEVATGRLELAHLSRTSLLGELSGAFAHELNQPLTSILANAQVGRQLIESGKASPAELDEIPSDIEADDKRAAGVITQLRQLLVKHEVSLEPLELNEVAAATLALAKSELVARQTKVDLDRAYPDVSIFGNLPQLQQIILNLIINAVDATSHLPPSGRTIGITVRSDRSMGEVAVSDNGHGLTREEMKGVFKPFVSTKSNGLGLGLAICRSIATAHGGTLQFDADYSGGARIVLSIPLYREQL